MAGLLKEIRDLPSASEITTGGGDYLHIKQGDVDRKIRVNDLFKWHTENKSNPHSVTKTQIGLDKVSNDQQLIKANNLTDVVDVVIARTHLDVYSKAEADAPVNAHTIRTDNPHSVTKAQVGLGNVTNNEQLVKGNNLSDVPDKAVARTNLNVYSKSETDSNLNSHTARIDNPHSVTKTQVGLGSVANFGYSTDPNNSSDTLYATIGAVNRASLAIQGDFLKAHAGMIMVWYGASNAIPSGWVLCDGSNGTPNLSGRFVIGAGSSYALGVTGGASTISHNHSASVQGHTLSWTEIPPHQHDSGWGEQNSPRFGVVPNTTDNFKGSGDTDTDNFAFLTSPDLFLNGVKRTSANPHTHGVTVNSVSTDNMPPYYALFYIMKT